MTHTLAPYQQRVITERAELQQRLTALLAFMASPALQSVDVAERGRLLRQASTMHQLVAILTERITAFAPELAPLNAPATSPALEGAPEHIKQQREDRCKASNVCPVCTGSGEDRRALSGVCRRCNGSGKWVRP